MVAHHDCVGPQRPRRHRAAWLHSERWTSTSSGRSRRPRSVRRWTRSSDRPSRLARRRTQPDGSRATRAWRPRGPLAARPAAPGPPRGPVADRLDQPAGAQLHLPAPDRAAGRGLRRRHVLRAVRDDAAAADGRPRLRRHRLPARRRGGRAPTSSGRSGRPARRRATAGSTWLRSARASGLCERAPAAMLTVAGAEPRTFVAGPIDAAGVAGRLSGAIAPEASNGIGGEQDKSAAVATGVPQAGQAGLRLLARVGVVDPTSLDAYRASGGFGALERARRDRSAAGHRRGRGGPGSSAAAAPPSRPAGSGPRSRSRRPSRTTSCATPTSRSRARSEPRPHGGATRSRSSKAMTIAAFAIGAAKALRLHPRRVPRRRGAPGERDRAVARPPGSSASSTSRSGAAPAPTSAARRPRSSSRSRASAASRATSRRSRSRSGCSASRPRSTTSRRSSTCS